MAFADLKNDFVFPSASLLPGLCTGPGLFVHAPELTEVPADLPPGPYRAALELANEATFTPAEFEAYRKVMDEIQQAREYGAAQRAEGEAAGFVKGEAAGFVTGKVAGFAEGKAAAILAILSARSMPVSHEPVLASRPARMLRCSMSGSHVSLWCPPPRRCSLQLRLTRQNSNLASLQLPLERGPPEPGLADRIHGGAVGQFAAAPSGTLGHDNTQALWVGGVKSSLGAIVRWFLPLRVDVPAASGVACADRERSCVRRPPGVARRRRGRSA
jgi:hypothetical protein